MRQGDPLSPYLFVLDMEAFSVLIEKEAAGGFFPGFRITGSSGEELNVTRLLFADDTLVFCQDSAEHMVYLSRVLVWFEALSGLKINLEKSSIFPVGPVGDVEGLALDLGCKIGALPATYLGLPLGEWGNTAVVWDRVEERFHKKLALWKRHYISKCGWLTLIRSTLSNMPTYLMFLFHIPRGVKLRLEKIQRDFLWGGGSSERKLHLINWKNVCSSKEKGGGGLGW